MSRTSVSLLILLAGTVGVTASTAHALLDSAHARATSRPRASRAPTNAASIGQPGSPAASTSQTDRRSPRNANYSIDVSLDPDTRRLDGREVLTWRNITQRATTELRFHLYYNAWKNTRSTWMREQVLARSSRLASRPPEDWGWITVTSVRLPATDAAPAVDLTGDIRHLSPDDGNPDDETVLSVPLPHEVEPGGEIDVEIGWTSKVPRTFARTGAIGDFFFLAQWFPKIGVLENSGWNCHQFHAGTEFFSDYGVYDVRLTVPAGWILGATGLRQSLEDNDDGTSTHHYVQEDVHDFAWTTSPDFLERTARFEHETLPPVDMRLLLQPEHAGQAERHFAATRATLKSYGEWYGPYPYGHITIVDPTWQSGAGGMEYPTLFTAGTRWLAPADVTQPEGVTVHEAGHQFWYGLVGNNEFEYAWLDEGLNTFSTSRTIAEAFSPNYYSQRYFGGFVPYVFHDIPLSRATDGNRLNGYRSAARSDVQSTPTYQYWPGTGGAITYNKTALWLHTLERHLGWDTLQAIMSTVFDRWSFGHPAPRDFFAAANEVSGTNLNWFFGQVHRSSNVFDYGIQQLTSRPIGHHGFFGETAEPEFSERAEDPPRFRTDVVVRRYGEATFPVELRVVFADGEEVHEPWDGLERWTLFTYERDVRAVRAEIDPDRVLLLDVNYTNNSKTLTPRTDDATTKWMLKWMVWLQDLMLTYAFFV